MMQSIKNILLPGTDNLPVALDIFFENSSSPKPVVIYVHGFNGFKDWGNFDLMAAAIAKAGLVLVKFNFSHNGTNPQNLQEFSNLQAFGNNNYSMQLSELEMVIDWVASSANEYNKAINKNEIYLIGHSMGGGICILHAAADSRIKKLVGWAAINECKTPWGNWPFDKMQEWKTTGVQYYLNGRTAQQMPLYYQLYEDYMINKDKLDIKKAIQKLSIPVLICHGIMDTAVPVEKAYELKELQPAAEIFTVDSDHVFGRKHPWTETALPPAMQAVLDKTLQFLKQAE